MCYTIVYWVKLSIDEFGEQHGEIRITHCATQESLNNTLKKLGYDGMGWIRVFAGELHALDIETQFVPKEKNNAKVE